MSFKGQDKNDAHLCRGALRALPMWHHRPVCSNRILNAGKDTSFVVLLCAYRANNTLSSHTFTNVKGEASVGHAYRRVSQGG